MIKIIYRIGFILAFVLVVVTFIIPQLIYFVLTGKDFLVRTLDKLMEWIEKIN